MTTINSQTTTSRSGVGHEHLDSMAPTDHLSRYFRDLSEFALLSPEQEIQFARDIESLETATWHTLLANPWLTEYALDFFDRRVPEHDLDLEPARLAAATARRTRTSTARDALIAQVDTTAVLLRASDLDRHHIDAFTRHLRELSAAAPEGRHTGLPFAASTESFAESLKQALSSDRQASHIRRQFVLSNLRLVITMARRYDRGGLPLADLIQEGNLGLMHAVSRFDHRRKLRFSTYACWWIRHAIGRAVADKSRTVRVPVHMTEAQGKLQRAQHNLTDDLGRQPTAEELAGATKLSVARVRQMHQYLMGQAISIDRPIHESDRRSLGETLTDPLSETISPADRMIARALVEQVEQSIGELSPIEADVIQQRFGLSDDPARTFRELSDQHKLSRERIRQIQKTALRKLRHALVQRIDTSFTNIGQSAA